MSPEWSIIALNVCVVLVTYLSVMPYIAKSNIQKMMLCDVGASCVSLFIVGNVYWGTGHAFSFILFDLNWFWFTLLTYAIVEVPAAIWYGAKYKIDYFK